MVPSADSFIASLARYLAEDGMPPATGRMLGWLLLRDSPSSLDELAEGLRISKSAASDHGRLLARLGAVDVRRRPGDRRDYYEASAQLCEHFLEHWLLRLEVLGGHLAEGAHIMSAPSGATARISQALAVNERITDCLRELVASLRERSRPAKD
jgi:DNA-binding MarR family transcriptional regulator